ncbi:MAG: InlB B-repeat-containing protein, partial [Bacteroidota bacterium]|nr:InlB B-repeat-containing protein [Bacteroidota bacterium]
MKRSLLLLSYIFLIVSVFAENKISTASFTIHPGDTMNVSIDISNDLPMIAFQFDLYLPEGIKIVKHFDNEENDTVFEASLTERKDASHLLSVTDMGNKIRFISYSMSNAFFKDGSSPSVVTLKLVADANIAQGKFPVFIKDALYTQGGKEATTIKLNDAVSYINAIYRYQIAVSAENGGTATGTGTYSYGDSVTVKATPQTGYSFLGWYENNNAVSSLVSYTFKADAIRSLTAKFSLNTYQIAVSAENGGTVTGAGTYNYGDSVAVKATPQAGYSFLGWYEGNNAVSSSVSYTFKADAIRSLTAKFSLNTYQIAVSAENGGTV